MKVNHSRGEINRNPNSTPNRNLDPNPFPIFPCKDNIIHLRW